MRVLLIDDSRSDRALAGRELKRQFGDVTLIEVDSAEEYERAFAEDAVDLIVTDYRMGWMDGLDVLRAAKSRFPDVPVIMFTGTGGEEVAVEAMREGVDDYVLKSQTRGGSLGRAARAALERARQRGEIRRLERSYRDLFMSVPVGLCRCTEDGKIIEANAALATLVGAETPDALAAARLPGFLDAGEEIWNTIKLGDALEARVQRGGGAPGWAIIHARRIGAAGPAALLECALTDVTQNKKAQDERTTLLGELYHRVNNNLQLMIGFVASLSNRTEDQEVKQGLEDLTTRIHSIALVQERLYKSGDLTHVDFHRFLEELAETLLRGSAIGLTMELDKIDVPVARAIPLGLIANELLMNCLKHAFSTREQPAIRMSLKRESERTAVLIVEDNGSGIDPSAATGRSGYGTRLLRSLSTQADAAMDIASDPQTGTRIAVRFPLDREDRSQS